MPLITWNSTYSVKVSELDSQHQRWFEIINNLHEAMLGGKGRSVLAQTLNDLTEYTSVHFSTEEKYLSQYSYPDYQKHKDIHDVFVKRINQINEKYQAGDTILLTVELMDEMRDWLLNHILIQDKAYSTFLSSKGVQ